MASSDAMSVAQGSEQMAKFGVNVPPGIPVFSLDEVAEAAKKMESPDGEVRKLHISTCVSTSEKQACTTDDLSVMFLIMRLCHGMPQISTGIRACNGILCLSSIQPMACCSINRVACRWL